MKLPQIYTHFHQGQVFTIDEARLKLGTDGNTLRKRLSDLSRRGYISPIRQGLYRLCKIGESRFERHSNSPYEIASKLTSAGHIGYKTALQFHAQIEVPKNDTVCVVSATKFNNFEFDRREYIWCQSAESYGIETHVMYDEKSDHEFFVSTTDIEKTIVDCLKRPAHCPAFHELIDFCEKLPSPPNVEKLLDYIQRMNVRSLYNRLGYLFEQKQCEWDIPENTLLRLEKNMSQKAIDWTIPTKFTGKNRWKIHFLSDMSVSLGIG